LYGALAAAASSGGALAGALGMAAFAAGTVPALLAVGLAGHVVGGTWAGVVQRAAPVLLLLNAGLLSYMAWRLLG
jgi:sulfite exporter TauE/SafE